MSEQDTITKIVCFGGITVFIYRIFSPNAKELVRRVRERMWSVAERGECNKKESGQYRDDFFC
jgi:hypothetical protein